MHPAIDFAEQKNGTPHVGLPSRQSSLQLPAELAIYRRRRQLLKVPYEVPLELWVRCAAPHYSWKIVTPLLFETYTRLFAGLTVTKFGYGGTGRTDTSFVFPSITMRLVDMESVT